MQADLQKAVVYGEKCPSQSSSGLPEIVDAHPSRVWLEVYTNQRPPVIQRQRRAGQSGPPPDSFGWYGVGYQPQHHPYGSLLGCITLSATRYLSHRYGAGCDGWYYRLASSSMTWYYDLRRVGGQASAVIRFTCCRGRRETAAKATSEQNDDLWEITKGFPAGSYCSWISCAEGRIRSPYAQDRGRCSRSHYRVRHIHRCRRRIKSLSSSASRSLSGRRRGRCREL